MLKKKIILGGLILSSLIVGYTNADITVLAGGCGGSSPYEFCAESDGSFGTGSYGKSFVYSKYNNNLLGWTWNNGELLYFGGYKSRQYGVGRPLVYCETTYGNTCGFTRNGTGNDGIPISGLYSLQNVVVDSITRVGYNYFNNGNAVGSLCFNMSSPFEATYCVPGTDTYHSINGDSSDITAGLISNIPELREKAFSTDTIQNYFQVGEQGFHEAGGPQTEGGPISCINIKTQIMLYGNKYNTGMCYTNGLYFSGFTPIQTGKLSIFEVFPSYQDYQNMANTYNTYCHAPYTQEYCNNAMSGYNEGMDFFTNIYNANNNSIFTVEAEKLYQYCHLQLNFTEEEKRSECKDTVDNYYATGVSEEASNGNPFEGVTDRLEDNIQIAVPTTGTVFDEFLDGDTRIVGITDRYGNFKDIYHKIMGLFKYRNTQQGIIPGYITAMIMLILLLAIIKK